MIPLDKDTAKLARVLQRPIESEFVKKLTPKQLMNIKPPDAVQVASAQRSKAIMLHTFDSDILDLNGQIMSVGGDSINICEPTLIPNMVNTGSTSGLI